MAEQQMDPEQLKALQEKIKKMSPEELKEFQKQQCIFCQIISGKVASKKIYEDEHCFVILDINPSNPGHMLVLPKEHYQIMPMIPDEVIGHLGMVVKALSHAALKALKAEGTSIFIANGVVAGQRAQHFMMHVIPRKQGDKLPLDIPEKTIEDSALDEIRKLVRENIEKIFKLKKERVEIEKEEKEEIGEEKKEERAKKEEKQGTKISKKDKAVKKKKPAKKKEDKEIGVSLDDIAGLLEQ